MSFIIPNRTNPEMRVEFIIPSLARLHFRRQALFRGAAVFLFLACLTALLVKNSNHGWSILFNANHFVAMVGTVMGVIVSSMAMVITLVHWQRAYNAIKSMLLSPYPPGLVRGRQLMDEVKSFGPERQTPMHRDLCTHAVYMKLREEGYDQVLLGELRVKNSIESILFLQERGCILNHDGGRTVELFVDKTREQSRLCMVKARRASDAEPACLPIYSRLLAGDLARKMDAETPQAQAIGRVTRF